MMDNHEHPPLAEVSGFAYSFFYSALRISGAQITVVDADNNQVLMVVPTDQNGKFGPVKLRVGQRVLFRLNKNENSLLWGYRTTQTSTFTIPPEGINDPNLLLNVALQVPSNLALRFLSCLMWVTENRAHGQIAVTVTPPGTTMANIPQGEPGVKVTLFREGETEPVKEFRARYLGIIPWFHKTDFTGIFGWHELTSEDGGVLFMNVPDGDYILRAEKEGFVTVEIRVQVKGGVVTNASPSHGLVMERAPSQ